MAGSEYPEDVATIKALYTSPKAVADGIRYLEEGVHAFEISNGARFTVYASAYTPAFCDWGFAYERDEDRFNDGVKPSGDVVKEQSLVPDFPVVDIMITHGERSVFKSFVGPCFDIRSIQVHPRVSETWSSTKEHMLGASIFGKQPIERDRGSTYLGISTRGGARRCGSGLALSC